MAAKPRETYDIAETAVKWGAALDRLRAEQRPGVKSGWGGKAAVLQAVRDRLQALAADGYTTGQMTDALRTVIPSMSVRAIRAALREAGKRGRQRKSARATRARTAGSGDSPPMRSVTETAAAGAMPAAGRSDVPIADASPSRTEVATAPAEVSAAPTGASPPSAALTPELRAQHRIPEWADGADIRPGEDLAAYARRKRVAGRPRTPDELKKFIGES